MSWAAWRPVRKEAAARRHNQAWTKAKATITQDSARQVSVAQSTKVRGGHEQCPGLVQEADVDVWMCGWWGHQPEREKSSSPGLGSGERRLKRSSQSPPHPPLPRQPREEHSREDQPTWDQHMGCTGAVVLRLSFLIILSGWEGA